jgi:hypothetical protein
VTVGAVVVPDLLRAAGAQEAALTPEDLAAFTQTAELAAVQFYGTLRPHLSRPAALTAAAAYLRQHSDAAAALDPLAGSKRVGTANVSLLPTLDDQLHEAHNENEAIRVAYDLENSFASTYLFLVDAAGADARVVKLAGSLLPVAAQRAVTLGTMIGKSTKDLTAPDVKQLGYESEDKHLDPAAFPSVVTTTSTTTAKK